MYSIHTYIAEESFIVISYHSLINWKPVATVVKCSRFPRANPPELKSEQRAAFTMQSYTRRLRYKVTGLQGIYTRVGVLADSRVWFNEVTSLLTEVRVFSDVFRPHKTKVAYFTS
jgi:hypothetical protein